MKPTEQQVASQAEGALCRILQDVPLLEVMRIEPPGRDPVSQPDLVVWVRTRQETLPLIVEVKSSGEPRLARQAANQLLQYLPRYDNAYGVFLAPYVSPAGAEICAAHGIGFLDLSGNCRLSFGPVFLERAGRPNRFGEKRDLRTLCSRKASRVLRVLLTGPRRPWKTAELARQAEVSLGLVSNVKRLLKDREWIREVEEGFTLAEPRKLLGEWAQSYAFRRNEANDYYSLAAVSEVESNLAALCSSRGTRYALAAFSAAARMAPAVRYQRAFAYVDGPVEEVARDAGLKKVASGSNVTLLEPYDAGVFYGAKEFDGIWAVSPVQTYLDLLGFKGRGEEAAEAVLKEVIEPQW